MVYFSQNDEKWGNEKLGFSDTLIKDYGCVITSLANMFDTTPLVINDYLKNNGGFVNGNLVYWAKVPGFVFRGWSYNNDEVKNAIQKYGACIVQVDWDGNPRTDGDHYVVFIGNQKLIDPWDGKVKPTSTYSILKGYVVYDIEKAKQVFKQDPLQACLEAHRQAVEAADKKDKEIEELKKELEKKDDEIKELNIQIKNYQDNDEKSKKQLNAQQDEIEMLRNTINGLEKKIGLLQNETETKLAKKDIDCQDKLKDQEVRMAKDFELKEQQLNNRIKELEEKVKKKEVVKVVKPIYKNLKEKLLATIEIWF